MDRNIFEEDVALHAADRIFADELHPVSGSTRLYHFQFPKTKKRTSSRKKDDPASYRAYVFEGYPTEEQAVYFCQTIGNCRFLWNRMLDDHRHGIYHTPAWYKKQPELSWLNLSDCLALCNVQLNLEAAESDAKSGDRQKPRFHKKGVCRDSYKTNCQYPKGGKPTIRLSGGYLRLPRVGSVRVEAHRPVCPGGILKSVTVSHEPDGKWLFSVVFQYPDEPFEANEAIQAVWDSGCTDDLRMTGLDMSLPHLYIDADGQMPFYELKDSTVCFDKAYRRLEGRIAREQRKLSHMKKHSHNYRKQQRKIAGLHAKAKHQRHDFLRQMAVRLARKYDLIGIEDLDMQAMKKSLKFGKSVSDNGWGLFTLYLEEACKKTGSLLIRVDKWFPSSKTCHHCEHIYHDLKLNDRTYICPVCGHIMNRDYQAAQNIRDEAFRIFQEISQGMASA